VFSYSQHGLRQTAPVAKAKATKSDPRVDPARDAKLARLWAQGMSGIEIAKALGFARRTSVYAAAARLKLPARNNAAARDLGEVDRIIRECWPDRSLTTADIAAKCGWRHGQAVTKRARALGLPNRLRVKRTPA
jgi:ribosomal protein L32E